MNLFLSSWDFVQVYLTVMREGSLSSAARKLGTSQPTVRRQIEALETELGVPLFTRAPLGLIPTERGNAVRAQAENVEAAMGAFRRSASGPAQGDSGTVRISCSEVYGVEIMPQLLSGLMKRHPNLQIELVLSNRNEDLLKREADIAVRMVAPQQMALLAKKVAPVALGFFASKDFLQTYPPPKTFKGLAHSGRFIGDDRKGIIAQAFSTAKLTPPQSVVFRTDSDVAQLAAIRAGAGIGITQVKLAKRFGLVQVLRDFPLSLESWVVMHEDLKSVRRVRVVFEYLVEALK